ncbi:hypothetical protein [Streptomyces sp. NPDC058486]|uniref:hypothetical protein n=1 Tax=unclassified Streptomyces TaxID=2593676 RepID=UPI00365600B9
MFLIHVKFDVAGSHPVQSGLGDLVRAAAHPDEGLEHVTVHLDVPGGPVLGMFFTAARPEQAEEAAARVCRRALAAYEELRPLTLIGALAGPGRLMTPVNQSTENPFHPF